MNIKRSISAGVDRVTLPGTIYSSPFLPPIGYSTGTSGGKKVHQYSRPACCVCCPYPFDRSPE